MRPDPTSPAPRSQDRPAAAPPTLAALERRLARLERSERRWRGLALGLVLAAGAAGLVGFARPRERIVSAERFVVVDADGTERGAFGLTEKGDAHAYLRQGDAQMIVSLQKGANLLLRGEDGRRGAFLGVDTAGASRLELVGEKLVDGVHLVTKPDGGTGLFLTDATGFERGTFDYHPEGGTSLTTRDERSRVRTFFGLDARGVPSVVLRDVENRNRIGMLLSDDGQDTPLLAIEDATQTTRLEMSTRFDGSPYLRLYRQDGEKSYELP